MALYFIPLLNNSDFQIKDIIIRFLKGNNRKGIGLTKVIKDGLGIVAKMNELEVINNWDDLVAFLIEELFNLMVN